MKKACHELYLKYKYSKILRKRQSDRTFTIDIAIYFSC